MKRIMFDTSVYGELIKELEVVDEIVRCIPNHIVMYGTKIIRNELRETPKGGREHGKGKKLLLLKIYDLMVRKEHHSLECNKLVETLAEDYFKGYKKQGGALSNDAMANDLRIIATATIYQLDIIVSDDEHSMLSNHAVKSYKSINAAYGLKNPAFENYSSFKKRIKRICQYDKQ